MMDGNSAQYLLKELETMKKGISDALVGGKCPDFAEYRYLCGQVRGLLAAQALIEDLARRTQENDDA